MIGRRVARPAFTESSGSLSSLVFSCARRANRLERPNEPAVHTTRAHPRHTRGIPRDPLDSGARGGWLFLDGFDGGFVKTLPHLLVSSLCLRPPQRLLPS